MLGASLTISGSPQLFFLAGVRLSVQLAGSRARSAGPRTVCFSSSRQRRCGRLRRPRPRRSRSAVIVEVCLQAFDRRPHGVFVHGGERLFMAGVMRTVKDMAAPPAKAAGAALLAQAPGDDHRRPARSRGQTGGEGHFHVPVPQQGHCRDAVSSGHHPGAEGRDLQPSMGALARE